MTTNTLVCPLCGKLYFSPCDHTARDLIAEIERLRALVRLCIDDPENWTQKAIELGLTFAEAANE